MRKSFICCLSFQKQHISEQAHHSHSLWEKGMKRLLSAHNSFFSTMASRLPSSIFSMAAVCGLLIQAIVSFEWISHSFNILRTWDSEDYNWSKGSHPPHYCRSSSPCRRKRDEVITSTFSEDETVRTGTEARAIFCCSSSLCRKKLMCTIASKKNSFKTPTFFTPRPAHNFKNEKK